MESDDNDVHHQSQRKQTAKKVPPVPIKTYQWEEVRRRKRRGKYPYTHLHKGPYKEMENGHNAEKKVKKLKKIAQTEPSCMETELPTEILTHDDEKLKGIEEIIVDVDAKSKNTESEDTYTESNVEQYLDKEDAASKSVNASITDLEQLPIDPKPEIENTLKLPTNNEEELKSSNELTKSNLSLFEKMKKAKFKMPTFKIPTKTNKKPSKAKKLEPKLKVTSLPSTSKNITTTKKQPDSPVYIYIPLKPTPEQLELERQEQLEKEKQRRPETAATASSMKRTNGKSTPSQKRKSTTVPKATTTSKLAEDIKKFAARFTTSPKTKQKKSTTQFKKPKPLKKAEVSGVVKETSRRDDEASAEFIYIPLKSSVGNEEINKPVVKDSVISKWKGFKNKSKQIKTVGETKKKDEEENKIDEITTSEENANNQKEIINAVDDGKQETNENQMIQENLKLQNGDHVEMEELIKEPSTTEEEKSSEIKEQKTVEESVKAEDSADKADEIKTETTITESISEIKDKEDEMEKNDEKIDKLTNDNEELIKDAPTATTEEASNKAEELIIEESVKVEDDESKKLEEDGVEKIDKPLELTNENEDPTATTGESNNKAEELIIEESVKVEDDESKKLEQEDGVEKINKPLELTNENEELVKEATTEEANNIEESVKVEDDNSKKLEQKDEVEKIDKPLELTNGHEELVKEAPTTATGEANNIEESVKVEDDNSKKLEQEDEVEKSDKPLQLTNGNNEDKVEEMIKEADKKPEATKSTPKKSMISKWKDIKQKTTSNEKHNKKKHSLDNVDDKPVEYIYIPLNPTKEQLAAEREHKLQEELKQKKRQVKTTKQKGDEKKQGAIKKKITTTKKTTDEKEEKNSKLKELTEDIKKFALKLKNLHKKPTFKTFKRGTKVGSSKKLQSPPATKKPNSSSVDNKKSTTTTTKKMVKSHQDTPVDYIFIPLKDAKVDTVEEEATAAVIEEINPPSSTTMTMPVEDPVEQQNSVSVVEVLENPPSPMISIIPPVKQISKEDEEDGLNTQTLKSSLNTVEDSPKLNKKVSFQQQHTDYETIQTKSNEESEEQEENKKQEQIVDVEVNNKWSKLSDHEYEPINPPPEPEVVITPATPPVNIITSTPSHTTIQQPITKTNEPISLKSAAKAALPPAAAAAKESRFLRIPLNKEIVVQTVEQQVETISAPSIPGGTRIETKHIVEEKTIKKIKKKKNKTKPIMQEEQQQQPGSNIQDKLRTQAGRLKTKIKNIKRPKLTIPNPNFKRPKFTLPKMPERPKINFPSFNLPRRNRNTGEPTTTESSNEPKKNTYPRFLGRTKKLTKPNQPESEPEPEPEPDPEPEVRVEFATVPRATARKKGPIGLRWAHRFSDIQYADDGDNNASASSANGFNNDHDVVMENKEEVHLRYEEEEEIDIELREYERENQNINQQSQYPDRWKHGTLHEDFQENERTELEEEHSSVASSESRHQHGVLEEIDSDQFFLREKGISQDNIEMVLYLSSEIRDAFRQPVNALTQMEEDINLNGSDLSLPQPQPNRPKRKQLKKTKRNIKKTPHASDENVQYDQESVSTEPDTMNYKTFPPVRPKRSKKSVETLPPNIIGYIPKQKQQEEDITEEYNKYLQDTYENEMMTGIDQPEIIISAEQTYEIETTDVDKFLEESGMMMDTPKPPARKQKSLKSLNLSEQDSIMGEFSKDLIMQDLLDQELNVYRVEHEYITPSLEELNEAPILPVRRTRSHSGDDDKTPEECIEPPCTQDIRDSMGYAIIDKTKPPRDPPLPSERKRQRNKTRDDEKFHTMPNLQRDNETPPQRPVRNYSTLVPHRPPRRKSEPELLEEKENVDITQYIEIDEDEHNRDLQCGEVINKMKDRPLPAPPRPPRKCKEPLHDVTHESNITDDEMKTIEEIEVYTQTDPLPDDFCCEEMIEEPTDRIVAPTRRKRSTNTLELDECRKSKTPDRSVSPVAIVIERRVHTPIENEDELTVTHASLLVKPVAEYQTILNNEIKREDAPEKPQRRKSSPLTTEFQMLTESVPEKPQPSEIINKHCLPPEVETLRAQRLQVIDLDVERLNVSELQAHKILVSEVDGVSLQISELNSKSGNLIVNGLEFPSGLLQEILDRLQQQQQQQCSTTEQVATQTSLDEPDNNTERITKNEDEEAIENMKQEQTTFIEEEEEEMITPDNINELKEEIDLIINAAHERVSQEEERNDLYHQRLQLDQEEQDLIDKLQEQYSIIPKEFEELKSEQEQIFENAQKEKQTKINDETLDYEELKSKILELVEESDQEEVTQESLDYEELKSRVLHLAQQTNIEDSKRHESTPPERPPLPEQLEQERIYYQEYSIPPQSFYRLQDFVVDDSIPTHHRRRRHRRHVSRSSTSEDDHRTSSLSRKHKSKSPSPSIPQLAGQLTRACMISMYRFINEFISYVSSNATSILGIQERKQDLQLAFIVMLVLIAGLILIGFGGNKTIHLHHWEYFNPPKEL